MGDFLGRNMYVHTYVYTYVHTYIYVYHFLLIDMALDAEQGSQAWDTRNQRQLTQDTSPRHSQQQPPAPERPTSADNLKSRFYSDVL